MNNVKLVIVESPNKIKKIQSLLGDGYKVMASVGHVRGLPQKQLGVHRQEEYRLDYEIDEDKKNIIGSLVAETKKLGRTNVLLATDPDREGEAIAFHLAEILGLNKDQDCRIMFHELTQKAIQKAIGQPTKINFQLVKAQEARRAIDRLAGFEVSNVLNHKLKKNSTESYSAGRVQSPALKLIVEREREITGFTPVLKYKLKASFLTPISTDTQFNRDKIVATQVGGEAMSKEDILFYFNQVSSHSFCISKVEKLQSFRNPSPAFTTSTLQQDAIKKFKWGAKKVMEVAQSLFEQGHITYMRTDSPNLSEEAILEIEQQLTAVGKSSKFKKTTYTAKGNAQEAHEAIRPTHFDARTAGENDDQQKLYSLIYLRAIASQMIPAEYSNDKISILDQTDGKLFESNKRSLVEAGFLEMYNDAPEEEEEEEIGSTINGKIAVGDDLLVFDMTGKGAYSNPPKRYDEAGLVKELEKRGIGRPSTYAAILNQVIAIKKYAFPTTIAPIVKEVEVIQLNHEFSVSSKQEKQSVGGDKNKLVPSEHGTAIIDFLNANFRQMMSYQFTSDIEAQLDDVVEGKSNYLGVMQRFDTTHSTSIKECQALPDVNASERKTTLIGQLDGHPVSYGKTEKGAYLLHQNVFYNLGDDTIPDLAQAGQIIKELKEKKALSLVHQVKDLVVKNGQYGYYIEDKKGNKAPLKMELDVIKKMDYQALSEKLKSYLAWKKNKR